MSIILINEDGSKNCNISIEQASQMAKEQGKSLKLLDPRNNVYKIVDIGKLKYEENIKRKQQKSQVRAHKIKEIKIGLLTEQHDLNIKAQHIHRFLEKGHKVKVTMKFKGRQASFKAAGLQKMVDLIKPFVDGGAATTDKPPSFSGNSLIVFLTAIKK